MNKSIKPVQLLCSKLLKGVEEENDKNDMTVFSPYSIFVSLCNTLLGADGETLKELEDVLGVDDKTIHSEIKKIHEILDICKETKISQCLFVNVLKKRLGKKFVEDSQKFYFADVKTTKFPNPGIEEVNKYVEKKTEGLIKKILNDNSCSSDTRLVLVNTLYFKAKWGEKFLKDDTLDRPFFVFGKEKKVKTMKKFDTYFPYGNFPKLHCSACKMNYVGNTFGMLFVLPSSVNSKDEMDKFELNYLKNNFIGTLTKGLKNKKLNLTVPKFKSEVQCSLVGTLQKIGIQKIFEEKANFKRMTDEPNDIFVSDIIHCAKIIVDEEGTEAAAATAMVFSDEEELDEEEEIDFFLNKPFYCFLIHNKTGSILFSTKVISPSY